MAGEKRPEWMTSISSTVDPEDYLLGRKIDKTFELSQKEKAEKAKEARIELLSKDKIKLNDDPILDLERRKKQLKMDLIQNPVMLKQFRDKLMKGELDNKPGQPSSSYVRPVSKKSKVQVHGAKPEMPAFLQRIKEQIVANEHTERKERSDQRRRDRSRDPNRDDDDPTIVKVNDEDLTEAEYKRMKLALETQYKISDDKSTNKRQTEELDIDQLIKSDRPSVRDYEGRTSSRTTTDSKTYERRSSEDRRYHERRHDSHRDRDDRRREDGSRSHHDRRRHEDSKHEAARRPTDSRSVDSYKSDAPKTHKTSSASRKVLSYGSSDESD